MPPCVAHVVSGDTWGGSENQVLLQVSALRKLGWDARVLLFNSSDTYQRLSGCSIPCTVISENEGFLRLIKESCKWASEHQVQLVVTHGYKETFVGERISRALGIPLICVFHGRSESHSGWAGLKLAFYRWRHLAIARRADAAISVSTRLAEELGFVGQTNHHVILNAVGAPNPTSDPSAVTNLLVRRPAIVIVGRLVKVKRIDIAIRAIKIMATDRRHAGQVPQLYVIGSGPEEASLKQLAADLGVANDIHFLGFREEARDILSKSDLLLISSDSEGLPSVLLEAMQSGVPVASRDVGGIAEALAKCPSYPAVLVDSDNPTDLAAAASSILLNQQLQHAPAHLKHVMDSQFSPEAAAKAQEKVYRELLSR